MSVVFYSDFNSLIESLCPFIVLIKCTKKDLNVY